ncbi:hypothetical protein HK405_010217, partial [Cladochytrium tenue]
MPAARKPAKRPVRDDDDADATAASGRKDVDGVEDLLDMEEEAELLAYLDIKREEQRRLKKTKKNTARPSNSEGDGDGDRVGADEGEDVHVESDDDDEEEDLEDEDEDLLGFDRRNGPAVGKAAGVFVNDK